MELTNDYMRFCNTSQLREKHKYLKELNQTMVRERRCKGAVPKKTELRDTFLTVFERQIDIIIEYGADEKTASVLSETIELDLTTHGVQEAYMGILRAVDQCDLEMWAKVIIQKHAEIFKIEEAKRKEKAAKQSYWSYMWGGSSTSEQKSNDTLIP